MLQTPECTRTRHFYVKKSKIFWGGGTAPPQTHPQREGDTRGASNSLAPALCAWFRVSVFLCVRSGTVNMTSLKWELNVNGSKTVEDTDFKFDTRVSRESPDMNLNFFQKGRGQGHVTP